jgi:hypothetical protein
MRTRWKWIISVAVLGTVLIVLDRSWIAAGFAVLVILAMVYAARSDKMS